MRSAFTAFAQQVSHSGTFYRYCHTCACFSAEAVRCPVSEREKGPRHDGGLSVYFTPSDYFSGVVMVIGVVTDPLSLKEKSRA